MNEQILDFIFSKYQTDYYYRYGHSSLPNYYSFYTVYRNRLKELIKMMPASANSVLDAGAGPGVMMNYFLLNNNYSNVVAIDQTADNDLVELSPHQNFKIMDICKLDFETNAFELVICTQVLEHLLDEEQINQALRELRRVSSKTLIISVPFEEPEPLNTGHYHAFDLTKIKKLFPSGTYTIIDHGNFNAKFKHIFITEVKE